MKHAALLMLCLMVTMGSGAGADDRPEDHIEVTLRTAASAVYPKDDLVVVVSFHNVGYRPVPLGRDLFSIDTLSVRNRKGPLEPPADAADVAPSEVLALAARETYDWQVNLSAWYPGLTKKKERVTIEWSAGTLSAEPLEVVIIKEHNPRKDRLALIETEVGTMTWRLLPEHAPAHVKNFVDLARQGHYDGLTIYRAVPGYSIEGGDPKGNGTGGWDELLMPEIDRRVPPLAGMVGALRRETSMTSNTIFFILLAPAGLMQGKQTFFAVLEDGWETVSQVLARPRKGNTQMADAYLLHNPVKILSVSIK